MSLPNKEKGFCFFFDWIDRLRDLDPSDAWSLVLALDKYYRDHIDITDEFNGALRVVLGMMIDQVRRAEKKSEENRARVQKRWSNDTTVIPNDTTVIPNDTTKTKTKTKTKTETETTSLIRDVIIYLNQKLGTRYNYSADYIKKHINARLSEGYTLEDFKTVIDKKYKTWSGTEMAKFLRPETLFGTKFASYLNELEGEEENKSGRTKEPYQSTELYGDYVG
jgi:uncharacterized phage protein (TIGR02220 family)